MKKNESLMKMVTAALMLALSYLLPFLTGQIPEIGSMLLPMHIPVLICGFLCGPSWGFAVGAIAPIFRSLTLSMPPLFPTALCMAAELATYGALSGAMYKLLPKKRGFIYVSLLIAMIAGRLVWGAMMFICMVGNGGFTFSVFIAGALTNAIPGIVIQIILVPIIVALAKGQVGKIYDKKR